ncbi:glycoside hydrolase [Trametes versicolor FP-101664 SS1]|uniref:glycoside hydrolase n=1 Tax=Trametes versicolor (strain FP-101664) TaxID=717944 RepID=UPI00046244B7|nr:glycoside hydrolase [Trametes versicolor FP-101664 SS1]EIW64398.1 glycoside hydrolase [Trametes versicolor FP-101664 SS1]
MMRTLLATCVALWALLALGARAVNVPRKNPKVPPGFVTTSGSRFELDGKPFSFVGANSYWLPLLLTADDVEKTFQTMQQAGVKVLRTWGFNAINATELPDALDSNLTYYQVWNSSQWILNDGPQGLQRLDHVISTAGKHGIKVILAFTNNWVGYGGSDLFVNWIAGANQPHDVFFTDPRIIASYQSYVKTLVERYKDSSDIFAWELMNEARCLSDTLPAGPSCVPGSNTLKTWYQQQSDFVRSLDPNHLITTGGEGHFFWKKPAEYWFDHTLVSDYNFNGQAGEDFDHDMLLSNIDFGTYHLYPQSWYTELDFPGSNWTVESWGLEWIDDHARAASKANKPVILEEFGVGGLQNKTDIYPKWVQRALDTHHASIMPWQWGELGLTESGGNRIIKYADAINHGASPNDGNTFYINQTAVWDIFTRAAKIQEARSG